MNSPDSKTIGPPPDRLELALRAGLRPVDPGGAFTAAVQARVANVAAPAEVAPGAPHRAGAAPAPNARQLRWYRASLALAASIVVALGFGAQLREVSLEQSAAQRRAHAQLLLALEITSEHLGLAQQRIEQFQAQEMNP